MSDYVEIHCHILIFDQYLKIQLKYLYSYDIYMRCLKYLYENAPYTQMAYINQRFTSAIMLVKLLSISLVANIWDFHSFFSDIVPTCLFSLLASQVAD